MDEQDKRYTVSQPDPALTSQHQGASLAAAQAQFDQGRRAYNSMVERMTPWLFDMGSWIFGGLIAFTLLILAPLVTARPVDLPIKLAIAAFALALPLNVTGLVLLRIVRDVQPAGFWAAYEEEIGRAFEGAGLTPQQVPSLTTLEEVRKRGTRSVLNTDLALLTLSCLLTVAGTVATLWHVAWWIAAAFGVVVVICLIVVQIVMVTAQPRFSAEQMGQMRRHRDELVKQAKELSRQAKEQR